ncbi:MAG: hypothetical protein JSV56_09505 [Methanomassiliicoccales archaeon]|nr:MAG: hypothetical protein JSV56_09505 [Methanomassiliicoccales archaeon]
MFEVKVHNYAFRKALAYIRNKRGRNESENIKQILENTIHQKLSTRSPYLPSYYPLKSFVIFLQIINSRLGEDKMIIAKKTNRYHDIGFYLYTGPEVADSPYHYLDPHKPLFEVVTEFYNNLQSPSGIFKDCGTAMSKKDSKVETIWKGCCEYSELFFYLEGVYAGMIKESATDGVLSAKKEGDAFIFEVELLD